MPLDTAAFAAALGRLLEAEGEARLPALVQVLRAGVAFDGWLGAVFRRDRAPLLLGAAGPEEPVPYAGGPYLLDPFFHRYRAGCLGWALLGEIAPAGFAASDYVTGYFSALGVGHELGFLAALPDGDAFHISVTRARGAQPFSRRERAWLEQHSALVAAAGRRIAPPAAPPDAAAATLHASLTRAFESFGASVLTPREGEVVRLLLQGHLSKAIARRLGISPGTARNHLKRIYPKLGVASHAELHALFLRALRVAEGEGDPLPRLGRN